MESYASFSIGPWMLITLSYFIVNVQSSDLVIGVICGDHCAVSKNTKYVHFHCISVVYYHCDMTNIFRVLETVHRLDNNASIDVVALLDNPESFTGEKTRIQTHNKRLIVWGNISVTHISRKIQIATEMKPSKCHKNYNMYAMNETNRMKNGQIVGRMVFNGPMVIAQILEYLHWKYVILLYENATVFEMSAVMNLMSGKGILCALYHIDDIDKLFADLATKRNLYHFTLQEKASAYVNLLVLCGYRCAKKALQKANDFDVNYNFNQTFLSCFSRWLFAIYGISHEFHKYIPNMDNILVVPIPELRINNQNFLPLLNTMLNVSRCMTKEAILRTIEKISSEVSSYCESYHITTLAWTFRGREFSGVGYIKPNGHIFVTNDLFPNTKYKYNNRSFHVSVNPYPPFVIKNTTNGDVKFTGFCIDILEELARILNFTYHISEVPDGNFGVVVNRTTMEFNGLIGQLQRNEVDMIVADIAITKDREQVMDFTFPFHYGFSTVLLKRRNKDYYQWRKLADPLKWQVVALVFVVLLVASSIMVVLERNNPFYTAALKSEPSIHNCAKYKCGFQSFYGSISYLSGLLLNEGNPSEHEPRSLAGRTFFSSWCLFGLIISGTYCGNLIASLTVIEEFKPFDSLREMVKLSDNYKWGTIRGTVWEQEFMTSSIPSYKAVGDGIRRFNESDPGILSNSSAYHIQRVKDDNNYAFIGDDGSIETAIAKDCRLSKIRERFLTLTEAFGFPDKSPHVKIFADKLMQMHESGLIKHLRQKWWRSKKSCDGTMKTKAKPINIKDVQSAFYVAAAGMVLSAVVLGIELIISRIRPLMREDNG